MRKSKTLASRLAAAGLALALAAGGVVAAVPAYGVTGGNLVISQNDAGSGTLSGDYKAYRLIGGVTDVTGTSTDATQLSYKISSGTVNSAFETQLKSVIETYFGSGITIGEGSDAVKYVLHGANSTATSPKEKDIQTNGASWSTDGTTYANEIMEAITVISDANQAKAFANSLAKALLDANVSATYSAAASNGTATFEAPDQGYYLVLNTSSSLNTTPGEGQKAEAATAAMLVGVDSDGTTVQTKAATPTIDKKVKAREDSSFADFTATDIETDNFTATYQIKGTLPTDIALYSSYKYAFTDTLQAGLTTSKTEVDATGASGWQVSIKYYKGGYGSTAAGDIKDVTQYFTSAVTPGTSNNSVITWTCHAPKGDGSSDYVNDIYKIPGIEVKESGAFVVEYTPIYDSTDIAAIFKAQNDDTLNGSTGAAPQTNTAKITFSNSPYADGEGNTPEDEAKVYSYRLKITKVNGSDEAVTGAKFQITEANGTVIGTEITADSDTGVYTFAGLDSDTLYTLTETTVPNGMKAISPITFKILDDDDGKQVTYVYVTENTDPSNAATWTETSTNKTNSVGTINVKVVNVPGSNMPGTGLGGITVFTVVGCGLAAGAAIVIVRRKKNEQAQ